jgi:predicted  nucleic acid-binding Zn-ribbon protein
VSRVNASTVIRETLGAARAQLDDLQAELEAGSREAEKVLDCAHRMEQYADGQRLAADALVRLRRRAIELRRSLTEQRALMRQLRDSFNSIRRELGKH